MKRFIGAYARLLVAQNLSINQKVALDHFGREGMEFDSSSPPIAIVLCARKDSTTPRTSYACCNVAKRRVAPSGSSWFLSG
jgi:hypothetical protein